MKSPGFFNLTAFIRHGLMIIPLMVIIYSLTSARSLQALNQNHFGDSIVIQKQFSSKKYKVRLYPNASHQVLFFSARGETGKIYQLFLFDVEGKLVKQANIKNNQTTVLNKIDKGNYLFEIFSDDERIENGQVIVR